MTLINIALQSDQVSIYSDTLMYLDGKPAALGKVKATISENRTFMVGTRGGVVRGGRYAGHLCRCNDLEQAVRVAREALLIEAVQGAADEPDDSRGIDVFLAGFHGGRGRMSAVRLQLLHGRPLEELWLADGISLTPEPVQERHRHRPGVWDDARAIKVALGQQEITNRANLSMCIGGSLWRSTITRHGAEQQIVALFPSYDADAALCGDPLAEAVAEFRRPVMRAVA